LAIIIANGEAAASNLLWCNRQDLVRPPTLPVYQMDFPFVKGPLTIGAFQTSGHPNDFLSPWPLTDDGRQPHIMLG